MSSLKTILGKSEMTSSTIFLILFVGLAGALGAAVRYLLGRFIAERVSLQLPLGTFLINVTGAFFIGLIFALTTKKVIPPPIQLILATGFLGAYTTFSTMSWEGVQLARSGSTRASILYLGGSMLCGLIAATLGLALGGLLW